MIFPQLDKKEGAAVSNDTRSKNYAELTSGSRLAKNAVWNLLGNAVPMLVAVVCIPVLIRALGTDRFGVLTLVWALIGYANLFDFGLGRALTQLVATKLGTGDDAEIPVLVWTSLLLMLGMGVAGTLIIIGLAPWLVHRVLHVPGILAGETISSMYLLAFSLPLVISTAGLRGLLEAYQRFGLTNALRVPMGALTFLGPLLVLPFSKSLFPVVAVLVATRAMNWLAHLVLCLLTLPALRRGIRWQGHVIGPLFRFGSWMTVSNVVGPLMVTLDRFVIGSLISVGAVAYYATPYEVVTKFWIIPTSLLGVMFPAFSTNYAQDRKRTTLLYSLTVKCLLILLFPMILLVVVLASDGLRLWLGPDFAQHSTRVLQWLAVGVFINCLALAPFTVLQSAGRPDLTAKLHLIELPTYLAALFWLTKTRGIEGAAIAWTGRIAFDAIVLFMLAKRFVPSRRPVRLQMPALVTGTLAVLGLASVTHGLALKSFLVLSIFLAFFAIARFIVLSPEERKLAQGIAQGL